MGKGMQRPITNSKVTSVDHSKKLKVAYILSYYAPDYVRTQTLLEALRGLDRIVLFTAVNRTVTIFRYAESLIKLVYIRLRHNPDCYFLGFRGHELFWFIRLITWRKLLIFDQMMSPYDSLLNESKRIKQGALLERAIYYYERSIMHAADMILTDTEIHRDYLAQLFDTPSNRVQAVPVGAHEALFKRPKNITVQSSLESLLALFYGSFLPLHGINVILQAAAILREQPIRFLLVGGNRQDLSDFHQQRQMLNLTNVTHQIWVDYEALPELIMEADLCLGGPFGNTSQGRRVITGKTLQALAIGKATIVGEIDQDYGFRDKFNALVVNQGDPKALAGALQWAIENYDQLELIGQRGHALYGAHFSIERIKVRMDHLLPQ
jgi:glycosyltransferase involved in cell wall biosynthesis